MATKLVSDIKTDVRKCLDRNETTSTFLSNNDPDTLNIDDIIESKIKQAVDTVHFEAPLWMLEPKAIGGRDVDWTEYTEEKDEHNVLVSTTYISGFFRVPDNFLRLVMFKMEDWEYPVFKAISMTDPEYIKQKSSVKGIRGNPKRPVCVLAYQYYSESQTTTTNNITTNTTLYKSRPIIEFYSCNITVPERTPALSKPTPEFLYMPKAEIDLSNNVDISDLCYDAVINMIAGLTLASCKEFEAAKHMMEIARSYYNKQI